MFTRESAFQSKLLYREYQLEVRRAVGVARWDLPAHCGSADPQSMRGHCPGPSGGVADG
jgi:hypothetical protein